MPSRILLSAARHCTMLLMIAGGCVGAAALLISWRGLHRRYAAEMMVSAVTANENDLEASCLLSSAVERVVRFEAQDEAAASLIPLLDVKNERICLRARFCILKLKSPTPAVITALIQIFRNPRAPPDVRIDTACMLLILAPAAAHDCGAAAAWRQFERDGKKGTQLFD